MHSTVMVRTLQKKNWVNHLRKKQESKPISCIHSYYSKKPWILNHLTAVHMVAISFVSLYAEYVSFQRELMGNSERKMEEKLKQKTEDNFLQGFCGRLSRKLQGL